MLPKGFYEVLVQGQKMCGLNLTSVKTKMMNNGHRIILPPGGTMLNCVQKLHQLKLDFQSHTFKKGF
jgi:hypothetical protein